MEQDDFAIYMCSQCFNEVPVAAIQDVLVCLNCRSILDAGQEPAYTCSEYSLYKIGWSQKKINKMVNLIQEVMSNEEGGF